MSVRDEPRWPVRQAAGEDAVRAASTTVLSLCGVAVRTRPAGTRVIVQAIEQDAKRLYSFARMVTLRRLPAWPTMLDMTTLAASTLTGRDVRLRMDALAPPQLAEQWDNVGWQIGLDEVAVSGILVTLDVEIDTVSEAVDRGANIIVAHHPMFFRPLKQINPASYQGRLIRQLLAEEIMVFAAHTNLDAVRDGVNGALAADLDLVPHRPLVPVAGAPENWGFGAICETADAGVTTAEMVHRVRQQLGARNPRVTPAVASDGNAHHHRIALLGGSGAPMIPDALRAGCTLYITGEVKYHEAQDAARAGLTLIEAGHFHSERPVLGRVVEWLLALGCPVYESNGVTSPFEADWEKTNESRSTPA